MRTINRQSNQARLSQSYMIVLAADKVVEREPGTDLMNGRDGERSATRQQSEKNKTFGQQHSSAAGRHRPNRRFLCWAASSKRQQQPSGATALSERFDR
jgi:hypothetical protein